MAKTGLFAELVEDVRRGQRVDPERAAAIVASEYLEGMDYDARGNIALLGLSPTDHGNIREMLEETGLAIDMWAVARHAVEECGGTWHRLWVTSETCVGVRLTDVDPESDDYVLIEGNVAGILDQAIGHLALSTVTSHWRYAVGVKIIQHMSLCGLIHDAYVSAEDAAKVTTPWWDSKAEFMVRLVGDRAELSIKINEGGKQPPEDLPVGIERVCYRGKEDPVFTFVTQDVGSVQALPSEILRQMLKPSRPEYAR